MSWPRAQYRSHTEHLSGTNPDIIATIHRRVPEAARSMKSAARTFIGATQTDTARNIWNFLKNQIRYKKDPPGYQFVKLPARLMADGEGDCKSYSLFTAAVLENLGIPYRFRYTSYDHSSIPQHVYIVTEQGDIIDAVWRDFNSEKPYTFKKDFPMKIYTLSGIGCPGICADQLSGTSGVMIGSFLQKPVRKAAPRQQVVSQTARMTYRPPVSKNLCMLGAYDDAAIGNVFKKAAQKVKKAASKVQDKLKDTKVVKKAAELQDKAKDTKVIKTLSKLQSQVKEGGVKAAALAAPRRAYRTLVAVNFRGWASKLAANPTKAREIWEKAGGSYPELERSINAGRSRKALFGKNSDQIRTVDGIGDGTLATIGALLALAAPLIALFKSIAPDQSDPGPQSPTDETAPDASSTGSGYEGGGDVLTQVLDVVKAGVDAFTGGGSSQPRSNAGSYIPPSGGSDGGYYTPASNSGGSPGYSPVSPSPFASALPLLGAAALGYFLLKKK